MAGRQHSWFRNSAITVPLIGAAVVALIAWFGDRFVTDYSSRLENTRLVTALQIQREQAESELRKDVFDQAIGTLLSPEALGADGAQTLSKRLLKLELLARNFGASLSLSPLFAEFDRDLRRFERQAVGNLDEELRIKTLRGRLRDLAKQLAHTQLAALEQHGEAIKIDVELAEHGSRYRDVQYNEYAWPGDAVRTDYGDPDLFESPEVYHAVVDEEMLTRGSREFMGTDRYLSVTLGALDPERFEVDVRYEVCDSKQVAKGPVECNPSSAIVDTVRLNFFRFPKIDNIWLSNNQRLALVLRDYVTDEDFAQLRLAVVLFPAEYASLQDRPSMREAVSILSSVLDPQGS